MEMVENNKNLVQTPLITVYGELNDFLLIKGNLLKQITADLSREGVDWQRSSYDISPVFVEADFVELDESKHFLHDYLTKDLRLLSSPQPSSNLIFRQKSPTFKSVNLNSSSLKRHRSLIAQKSSYQRSVSHQVDQSAAGATTSTANTAQKLSNEFDDRLFDVIARRQLMNGHQKLLMNSFWLGSNYDLESYNDCVRQKLLDWFQKQLTIKACHNRVGLSQDFILDFFVVIVIRNHLSSNKFVQNQVLNTDNEKIIPSSTSSQHSSEQLLNLNNLMIQQQQNEINSKVDPSLSKIIGNRFVKNSSFTNIAIQQQTHQLLQGSRSLSASTTALSSMTSSAHLTNQQLADQIRNDLLVCFQLFRQSFFTNGTFDVGIPSNNQVIAQQLLERIVIFDSTSNASEIHTLSSSNPLSSSSNNSQRLQQHGTINATNPIISSTARTFSALSNFSSGTLKITPMSSPTKSSRLNKSTSAVVQSAPVFNYSQFIIRLRQFLLDCYTRQFDCYEKLTRRVRELRTNENWDFFGFFLLQEELALGYEGLGLYNKALIQYDELEALFAQLLINVSTVGDLGPLWLRKRLIYDEDDEDEKDENDDLFLSQNSHSKNSINGSAVKNHSNQRIKKRPKSTYNSWNGLCLCNSQTINESRLKLVESVSINIYNQELSSTIETFYDDAGKGCKDDSQEYDANNANSLNDQPLFKESAASIEVKFEDPLGLVVSSNLSSHQGKSPLSPSAVPQDSHINLIDFRNYLFARQCHLLCLLNEPWELARRALPFLQICVAEIKMLEISIAPGGIACWAFLSALEILHKCERYTDSSLLESYSYHTVGLWAYARDNLIQLGHICNLALGSSKNQLSNSSISLHKMVELVAGMGTDPHVRPSSLATDDVWMSPQERLKDALSSSESFLKHYLEITEFTMGTYKHIGYIRSARLIGKELAELYLNLGKPQQALSFLLDLYQMFHLENWTYLITDSCQLLAQCLEQLYFDLTKNGESKMEKKSLSTLTNTSFNLDAIVRAAFRAYWSLMLSQSLPVIEKFDDLLQKRRRNCIDSMLGLYQRYKMNGFYLRDLDQKLVDQDNHYWIDVIENFPLLAIHNSQSDLFYDGCNSFIDNSSMSSSSNLSMNLSFKKTPNEMSFHHYSGSFFSNQSVRFLQINDIEISCESDSSTRSVLKVHQQQQTQQNQSFTAGSLLRLRLTIFSHLDIELELPRISVTMSCQNNDDLMLFNNGDQDNKGRSTPNTSVAQNCCLSSGTAKIESFHSETIGSVGLRCLNPDHLLRRIDSNSASSNLVDPSGRRHRRKLVISQSPPASLLANQRLSSDYRQKYFRFLLLPTFQFQASSSQKNNRLSPGSNVYELWFQLPATTFEKFVKKMNLLDNSSGNDANDPNSINHLWFNLDQLVMLCRYTEQPQQQSTSFPLIDDRSFNFFIIDDFSSFASKLSTRFRVVKCLPSIELVAKISSSDQSDNDDDEQHAFVISRQSHKNSYSSLFVGIEQTVEIRLNSGTTHLPKGLEFSIKIQQVSSLVNGFQTNAVDCSRSHYQPLSLDSIDVQLNRKDVPFTIDQENNEQVFCLDRDLQPFENYVLDLSLNSIYANCKTLKINPVTVSSSNVSMHHQSQKSSIVDHYDFKLTLSWNESKTSSQVINQNQVKTIQQAHCFFTLNDPFGVQPRLCTSSSLKFFQLRMFGVEQLPSKMELNFCYPKIISSSEAFQPLIHHDKEKYDSAFQYKLTSKHDLTFVWLIKDLNTRHCQIEVEFQAFDCSQAQKSKTVQKVRYDLKIVYDYRTVYSVRQWIEPLAGSKATELLRIGSTCLFRIKIERLLSLKSTEDSSTDEDDEHVMYEIVCDPELWSLISNYPSSLPTNAQPISLMEGNCADDKLTNNQPQVPSSNFLMTNDKGFDRMTTTLTSQVVRFSSHNCSFESVYEVTPLTPGYISLPSVRLSLYRHCGSAKDDVISDGDVSSNHRIASKISSTNAIESLSAMLTENLSKNWSKYLPTNNSTTMTHSNKTNSSSSISQQFLQSESLIVPPSSPWHKKATTQTTTTNTAIVSARLEPFKPGLVYNHNRATQVYVLPSI